MDLSCLTSMLGCDWKAHALIYFERLETQPTQKPEHEDFISVMRQMLASGDAGMPPSSNDAAYQKFKKMVYYDVLMAETAKVKERIFKLEAHMRRVEREFEDEKKQIYWQMINGICEKRTKEREKTRKEKEENKIKKVRVEMKFTGDLSDQVLSQFEQLNGKLVHTRN